MLGLQGDDVLIHLLLVQGVPEPQDGSQQGEAQRRHQNRDVEQTRLNGGIGAGGGRVADDLQQQTGQTGGSSLAQLAGEGVQGIDGTVLTLAVLQL